MGGGGGGGIPTLFPRSATSVDSRASPKRGGGGIRHISVFRHIYVFFFFLGFKRGGGHMYKKKGVGAIVEKALKGGGMGRVCPPP